MVFRRIERGILYFQKYIILSAIHSLLFNWNRRDDFLEGLSFISWIVIAGIRVQMMPSSLWRYINSTRISFLTKKIFQLAISVFPGWKGPQRTRLRIVREFTVSRNADVEKISVKLGRNVILFFQNLSIILAHQQFHTIHVELNSGCTHKHKIPPFGLRDCFYSNSFSAIREFVLRQRDISHSLIILRNF